MIPNMHLTLPTRTHPAGPSNMMHPMHMLPPRPPRRRARPRRTRHAHLITRFTRATILSFHPRHDLTLILIRRQRQRGSRCVDAAVGGCTV